MVEERTPEMMRHLEGLGFRPVPNARPDGCAGYVTLNDEDGVYYNFSHLRCGLQLIVVGTSRTPGEYIDAVGHGYTLLREFARLPTTQRTERQFYSLILERATA